MPDRWRWEIVEDAEEAESLAPAWNALAARGPLPALAGASFTLAQRAAFLRHGRDMPLHVLRREAELAAVLPLVRRRGVARGWSSFVNEHTPCAGFAMLDDPAVPVRVLEYLLATADRMSLHALPADGAHWRALAGAAESLGLRTAARHGGAGDTWLELPASEGALTAAMPGRLARELPRKLERLGRAGHVAFERIDGGPALGPALAEAFALEGEGWKGFTGTPILRDPQALRFYSELARRAGDAGELALYLLRVDGRLIAFRYCLRGGDRLDSLKTSFDPAWSRYSPGLLTQFLVARREIGEGAVRRMYLGVPSAHKLRWATGVVPLATLEVYAAGPRGQVASWPPRLRARAARLPALRRLAPRWHALAARVRALRHDLRPRLGKLLWRRLRARESSGGRGMDRRDGAQ